MPSIIQITCDKCEFNYTGTGVYIYLILDNGERTPLPHPIEKEMAFDLTGLDFESLKKNNRLGIMLTYCCFNCAKISNLDYKKDNLICPECNNNKIKEITKISNDNCPCCKIGTLTQKIIGWA